MEFSSPNTANSRWQRSTMTRESKLLMAERYTCCICLNVISGSFFLGVIGFIACLFYLMSMVLARLTYNLLPAIIGLINYSSLLLAQFTKKPCFYLFYIYINLLGIAFYSMVIVFLIFMLIYMPQFYVRIMEENIENNTHTKFSLEACRNVTILNACVYLLGIVISGYATTVVYKAQKCLREMETEQNQNVN